MATKTVVCPECGSEAAPGRYACAECGAMLASVGVLPRVVDVVATGEDDASDSPDSTADEADPAVDDHPATAPAVPVEAEAAVSGVATADTTHSKPEPPAYLQPDVLEASDEPFDENAPLAAAAADAHARSQPAVLRDVQEDEAWDGTNAPEAGSASAPEPSWPPKGDLGTVVMPETRTPAGAYLPPSAVLPALDPAMPVAVAGGEATAPAASTKAGGSWSRRASTALSEALGSVGGGTGVARRAVFIGSGIIALGMLLPWVNTLPGESPLAGYLDRWGLAGTGMWLVLLAAIGLGALAAASGRLAGWPVALPAVALAAFVLGLVWPYVFNGTGRSIGVVVAVIGLVVLAVGGLLDLGRRHEPSEPSV